MPDLDVRAVYRAHYAQHSGHNPGNISDEITGEEKDFATVVDRYKRVNDRPFPRLSELLALLIGLGYRKVAPVGPLLNPDAAACRQRLEQKRERVRRRQLAARQQPDPYN